MAYKNVVKSLGSYVFGLEPTSGLVEYTNNADDAFNYPSMVAAFKIAKLLSKTNGVQFTAQHLWVYEPPKQTVKPITNQVVNKAVIPEGEAVAETKSKDEQSNLIVYRKKENKDDQDGLPF